jgi:hypothetical protein
METTAEPIQGLSLKETRIIRKLRKLLPTEAILGPLTSKEIVREVLDELRIKAARKGKRLVIARGQLR